MTIIVQKFGGTSVGDIAKIKNVADIIAKEAFMDERIIVVVSAMSGVTNQLASYCSAVSDLNNATSLSEYDVALSSGETVTASLLALALQQQGMKARSVLAWQLPISTNNGFSKSLINNINTQILQDCLSHGIIPIIAGFQGITDEGLITTLGRGGSDTTAAAIAASMKAKRCDIYTDVEGVFAADPRLVHDARRIDALSYEEMLEFASMGAKVLHSRAVQIAMRYNIKLRVISSFTDNHGTVITSRENIMERLKITGITYNKNLAATGLKFCDYKEQERFLCKLGAYNIHLETMYQASTTAFEIMCIIALNDIAKCETLLEDLQMKDYTISTDIALVSIIGFGIKNDPAILATIMSCLSVAEINIMMILSSEIKISLMVPESSSEQVVKMLYNALELG